MYLVRYFSGSHFSSYFGILWCKKFVGIGKLQISLEKGSLSSSSSISYDRHGPSESSPSGAFWEGGGALLDSPNPSSSSFYAYF